MPDGYGGADFTWTDLVSAAVTLAVAIAIGTLWERWRGRG
jgi:hypothetical protein